MNKYLAFAFLICCLSINTLSQENKKDSLLQKLPSAIQKEKLKILVQLSDLSNDYIESINYSSRALIIANEIKDVNYQANINFNIGVLHYSEGKYMYSDKRFIEALAFFEMINDSSSIAKTYYWLALCNKYWGKYRNAIKYAQLSLDLNEKLKSVKGIVDVTLVFGYIYQAWGNQNQAAVYFHRAIKMLDKKSPDLNLGFAKLGKGNVLLAYSKRDSAKLFFDESYQIFLSLKNIYGQALSLRDLARYYMIIKDYKKAETSLDKSLGLLKSINNKRGISEVMVLKGDLYLKKGNYSRAIELYTAGQKLAIEMELHEEIVKNYKTVSKAYESKKDLPKAMKYYKLYSELKDSVFTKETFEQLSEMQTKYETEKKDKENKVLKIDNELKQSVIERQYILVLSVIIVLGLAVALAIIFFRGREIEKKNNQVLEQQKQEIELSHQKITDSINYASRIQSALLPETSSLKKSVKDYFVLYKPRDVVSGDFYWSKQINNKLVMVAADCTGHGVPGAFMSLLGISFLTEILSTTVAPNTIDILEKLRHMIKDSLKQDDSHKTTKDGIDMALCILNTDTLELQFAGANMPMYLIRNGKLEIFKGINNPIGIHLKEKAFENIQIQLLPNDSVYLFSDGFVDQFGGKKSEKFKPTHFRNALLAINQADMATQKQMLEDIFEEWKTKANDQTDDVLVLGFKV